MYKHYSFDLWGTLIKSNPHYKSERAYFFWKGFNPHAYTAEKVTEIIRSVEKQCDYSNELTGRNIHALEMVSMVLHQLGYDKSNLSLRDIQAIYLQLESLFEKYPPVPFSDDTIAHLSLLKANGATLSVLSNTAFIRGTSLSEYMEKGPFKNLFSFEIYSDMVDISKPSAQLFGYMISMVHSIRKFNPVQHKEIVHIGDNVYADIEGAKLVGISSIQINTNDKTIKDII